MQAGAQERTEYAGLGWRVAAIAIDTVVLFVCLVVLMGISAAIGVLELPDPNTTNPFDVEATQATMPTWIYFATYGLLFVYYAVLEGLTGASLGKLALGMRVRMDDGRPATTTAIIVRNLIRIPEALLWYIPSGISCLFSGRRKRLGDFAAGTVVVRRPTAARDAVPGAGQGAHGAPEAPMPVAPAAAATAVVAPAAVGLREALAALKATTLAVRGAHDTFFRLSEIELARQQTEAAGEEQEQYSPEYVAAWYSLSDAVHEMTEARATAAVASSRAGTTLEASLAAQPDLAYLLRHLGPYLAEGAAQKLHEAYVAVVRSETRP